MRHALAMPMPARWHAGSDTPVLSAVRVQQAYPGRNALLLGLLPLRPEHALASVPGLRCAQRPRASADAHRRVPALCALSLLLPCHAADGAPPRDTCALAPGACRPASRPCPPAAAPAGRLAKPPDPQPFTRSCTSFSPARVDNTLVRAPAPAAQQRPWCVQGVAQRCPLWRCTALYQRVVAGGRDSRPSSCPGTPGRTGVSEPAGTALRRQGRMVARAEGPRHRRPRLRHEAHRRGEAPAASKQARARAVEHVRLSAQPLADRSVQRLIPPLPLDCPRARLGYQAAFLPPVGAATRSNSRCALPVPLVPVTPIPLMRGSADRSRS
jgi:hypothetical protein